MVASHTAVPLGTAKWLERAIPTPVTLPLGKGQGLLMSPTQRQADIIGNNSIPAISQPLWGQLYGWLPLSNAYGIFFRCNKTHNQTLTAFSFLTIQPKPIGISYLKTWG